MPKEDLLMSSSSPRLISYRLLAIVGLIASLCYTFSVFWPSCHVMFSFANQNHADTCPQADVLIPDNKRELWTALGQVYGTEAFTVKAAHWLGGAVRIPTESYDDMGPVSEDPRWNIFSALHNYLLGAFPLVHSALSLTKVNTYALMYVWEGSDASLKPVLLAAHQDVVPVDQSTADNWIHPAYSGHFDGERIWGRGSVDDKSGLIGILSGIESLLGQGFQPTRTFVLAFGFDEEVSGREGAGHLSEALRSAFGENAFSFIIDEGGGFTEQYGSVFATPGITEKGYLDVKVEVTAPGGHSSVPPKHTSIGILSSLIVKYEANPYSVSLTREDPLYSTMQCIGRHGADVPSDLRKVIKRATHSEKALHSLAKLLFENPVYESFVGTTQAVDLIQGGVKVNALPELAWAVINHRISVISSVKKTMVHDTHLVESLAKDFNLTYYAFGTRISEEGAPSSGTLTLSDVFRSAHEPAPVTPTGKNAAPYQFLSGTIKAAYNSHRSLQGSDTIVVSPGMPSGNTDTVLYWKLSKHIFRYGHRNGGNTTNRLSGVHSVNESMPIDSFVEIIRFFTTLILNADESKTL